MTKVRVCLTFILLVAGMGLAGCDHYVCNSGATFGNTTCSSTTTTTTGSGTPVFVYYMDDTAGQIGAEAVNLADSQTFAAVPNFQPPATLSAHGVDGGLAIVNESYLYMPYTDGNVYGYSINATTAALTALTPVSLSLPFGAASPIAADPAGNFIFVGDTSGIYVLSVSSSSGALTVTNGGQPYAGSGLQPVFMTTDGLGKYLYVADGTNVLSYSYSSSGVLTSVGTLPQEPMVMLASEPTGAYMFGSLNSAGDENLYEFAIGSNGALSAPTAVSTSQPTGFIAVDPNIENGSELVFTFNSNLSGTGTVVEFPFNPSTGAFGTAVPETEVFSIGKFDQSGAYLIAVGDLSSSSTVAETLALGVSSTGELSTTLPSAGALPGNFAVTDEPAN